MIDKLLGLRNPASMSLNTQVSGVKPHFVGQQLVDSQGRAWYELDLAALVADEAFLKVDV